GGPGRRFGRLLRDLPRRRPLLPAGRGDARPGAGAPVRARRPDAADLHGLPRRRVALAQGLRREGGHGPHRPLDRRSRGPQEARAKPPARKAAGDVAEAVKAEELVPAGPAAGAVSEVAQLAPLTEEQSHFLVEQVWRFFCSLRLTLANLLLF